MRPDQEATGAPLITSGPEMSGLAAASTSVAQPPWQLPTMIGLGASGWRRRISATNSASARMTSAMVWSGSGCGRKTHEIDRMAIVQGDADLAVGLEAADAGAMAGARIDDHIGPLPVVHLDALRRDDLQQHVIARAGQGVPVHRDFVVVDQHRRRAGGFMGDVVVAALAQHVERQHVALRRVLRMYSLAVCRKSAAAIRRSAPKRRLEARLHRSLMRDLLQPARHAISRDLLRCGAA